MTELKNLFVPFELAKQLKEKGFDESCLTTYKPSPFPPYKWGLQSLTGTLNLHQQTQQHDSHKSGFTGYINSVPAHYGLQQIAAPLYQQVVDWLREEKGIQLITIPMLKGKWGYSLEFMGAYSNGKSLGVELVNQVLHAEKIGYNPKGTEQLIEMDLQDYYQTLTAAITEALKLI